MPNERTAQAPHPEVVYLRDLAYRFESPVDSNALGNLASRFETLIAHADNLGRQMAQQEADYKAHVSGLMAGADSLRRELAEARTTILMREEVARIQQERNEKLCAYAEALKAALRQIEKYHLDQSEMWREQPSVNMDADGMALLHQAYANTAALALSRHEGVRENG